MEISNIAFAVTCFYVHAYQTTGEHLPNTLFYFCNLQQPKVLQPSHKSMSNTIHYQLEADQPTKQVHQVHMPSQISVSTCLQRDERLYKGVKDNTHAT